MRLFLLPITTRRSLLYCQRPHPATLRPSIVDRATHKAADLWSSWEKKESGWQKTVVGWGNHALRRIPFEEWGLKSIPPLSARRKDVELREGKTAPVEIVFPSSVIPVAEAEGLLRRLGTEREALHKRKMLWCCIGMPITLPFALVPLIPNLPFFYLAYRAWSHWKALSGGKHIQFLLKNNLVTPAPSSILDQIYKTKQISTAPPTQPSSQSGSEAKTISTTPTSESEDADLHEDVESPDGTEKLLVSPARGKLLADALGIPELEAEVERAAWQVKHAYEEELKKKQAEKPSNSDEKQDSKKDR